MNLSYEYTRGNSGGTLNGKTGQMTRLIDNRDRIRDRSYEFDSLGRLKKAKGGAAAGAVGVILRGQVSLGTIIPLQQ